MSDYDVQRAIQTLVRHDAMPFLPVVVTSGGLAGPIWPFLIVLDFASWRADLAAPATLTAVPDWQCSIYTWHALCSTNNIPRRRGPYLEECR